MENAFDTCGFDLRTWDFEHIHYLIASGGGMDAADILKIYPQYDQEIIDKIIDNVSWFCWYTAEEMEFFEGG